MQNFTKIREVLSLRFQKEENYESVISKIIKNYTNEKTLIISKKILVKSKKTLIFLNYYPETEINPYKAEILFVITLSKIFPKEPPKIKCKTNFIYPSLYDNRELLESILTHKWSFNQEEDISTKLEEIIKQIPEFLKRVYQNITDRTLIYYGKIFLGSTYLINDFIENNQIQYFNVMHYLSKHEKKERYLILTDLYLLLFDPLEEEKSKGILIMIQDLRDLRDYSEKRQHKTKKKESLVLKFENGEIIDIMFINKTLQNFIDSFEKRIKWMNNRYNIFLYENYNENEKGNENVFFNKKDLNDLKKLKEIIQFKENLYNSTKNNKNNHFKELNELYALIIEKLSDIGEDFEIYLKKSQQLITENQKMEENQNKKTNQNQTSNNQITSNNSNPTIEDNKKIEEKIKELRGKASQDFQEKVRKFSNYS